MNAAEATKLCERCGAKCCRNPLFRPAVTGDERRLLIVASDTVEKEVSFEQLGRRPGPGGEYLFRLTFEQDGCCPFLDRSTNQCRAYEARPGACERFPHRPVHGCLIGPGVLGRDPSVELVAGGAEETGT